MKMFACTKGCWDPEFKPSRGEIVDYRWWWRWFSQFAFFGELILRAISLFSLAHGKWRSHPGQLAQAVCTNVRAYGACSVCQCVLVQIMGTVVRRNTFHEGQGMYMWSKFFITSPVAIYFSVVMRYMQLWYNYDETYGVIYEVIMRASMGPFWVLAEVHAFS